MDGVTGSLVGPLTGFATTSERKRDKVPEVRSEEKVRGPKMTARKERGEQLGT